MRRKGPGSSIPSNQAVWRRKLCQIGFAGSRDKVSSSAASWIGDIHTRRSLAGDAPELTAEPWSEVANIPAPNFMSLPRCHESSLPLDDLCAACRFCLDVAHSNRPNRPALDSKCRAKRCDRCSADRGGSRYAVATRKRTFCFRPPSAIPVCLRSASLEVTIAKRFLRRIAQLFAKPPGGDPHSVPDLKSAFTDHIWTSWNANSPQYA